MATQTAHSLVWALAHEQHGVVTRAQLLELGYSHAAIRHRIRSGRLHPLRRGVYALGRPELSRFGVWMAALLSCGPGAVLSHESAAALLGIRLLEARTDVHPHRLGERLFLPIARRAGLPPPLTRRRVNGFRVDFHWPDLCLVVETDGLRITGRPLNRLAIACATRRTWRRV